MNKPSSKSDPRFFLATITLLVCVLALYTQIVSREDMSRTWNTEFPSSISNWTGRDFDYDEETLRTLAADQIIYKTYRSRGSPPVELFLAHYFSLEKADLSHSPVVCFTGQGWQIEETRKIELPVNTEEDREIRVNQIIQKKYDVTLVTLYWYESSYGTFANRGIQKLRLFFDRLSRKRENNAFVRLTFQVPKDRPLDEAVVDLYAFVYDFYPALRVFMEDVEVC